jgi:hypothetical protein
VSGARFFLHRAEMSRQEAQSQYPFLPLYTDFTAALALMEGRWKLSHTECLAASCFR